MAKVYIKNTDGTYISQPSTLVSNLDIVQDKGNSLTSAMSQKAVTDELANKQDKLVAGDNIIIEGNVISSTGGGGGDSGSGSVGIYPSEMNSDFNNDFAN